MLARIIIPRICIVHMQKARKSKRSRSKRSRSKRSRSKRSRSKRGRSKRGRTKRTRRSGGRRRRGTMRGGGRRERECYYGRAPPTKRGRAEDRRYQKLKRLYRQYRGDRDLQLPPCPAVGEDGSVYPGFQRRAILDMEEGLAQSPAVGRYSGDSITSSVPVASAEFVDGTAPMATYAPFTSAPEAPTAVAVQ